MFNVDKLSEKIYIHFKEKKNRSYPLLLTKEDIKTELNQILTDENADCILDKKADEISGICAYSIDEEKKYLQTLIFADFDQNSEFILRVLDYLNENYSDFTKNIGVEAENLLLTDALKQKNFKLTDDSYSTSIKPRDYKSEKNLNFEKIDFEAWQEFKDIHDENFSDYYWTYERIKDNFNDFKIYSLIEDSVIRAYIFIRCSKVNSACEIFGIYGEDIEDRIALIEYAVEEIKDMHRLYFFTDNFEEMQACKRIGFKIHGHYQSWESGPQA